MSALASGVGSLPGDDAHDYAEATRLVLGELSLPHLPELPGRGAVATMTGRAVAMCVDLGFDLQPAGWRLTDAPGVDQRRATSLLAQDLDTLEEQAQGLTGELKVQVCGPWTLAATVEKPRGDKVLADVGARRDLAQALAEGVGAHVADVRRRVPGVAVTVQVDEPALPAVMGGEVPTASGFHRHRSVDPPRASEALEWVFAAIEAAGATPAAHCCAAEPPVALLRGAGASAVGVDVLTLGAAAYDAVATALDDGERLYLGVVPGTDAPLAGERPVLDRVRRLLDMIGLDPTEVAGQLVLTPSCGLAGASSSYAATVARTLTAAADRLDDLV